MTKILEASKQLTLDLLPAMPDKVADKSASRNAEKKIIITEIFAITKIDELSLKVAFRLVPSKAAFSKVHLDLWFDNQQISSVSIRIPQGFLATDEFELMPVLDMKGIPAGSYIVRAKMYKLWPSGEKLSLALKEFTLDYIPQTRESRFVKVPSVKSVAGTDLIVVSESTTEIYRGMEKTLKKERTSKRDVW